MLEALLRLSRHQVYARHKIKHWRTAWQRHTRRCDMRFSAFGVAGPIVLHRFCCNQNHIPNVLFNFMLLVYPPLSLIQFSLRTFSTVFTVNSSCSGTKCGQDSTPLLLHSSFVSNIVPVSLHTYAGASQCASSQYKAGVSTPAQPCEQTHRDMGS